jgi:hypothetical protein
MRFYPKTQKYEFSNLPQNNWSKRRSTRVNHVSEVSFEIGGLDLHRFGKPLKLSSSPLSFFLFLFLSSFTEKGTRPFSFLFFFFIFKVRRTHLLFFFFFYIFVFLLRRVAWPFSFLLWGTGVCSTYFLFLFLFLFYFLLFFYFFIFYFTFSLHF